MASTTKKRVHFNDDESDHITTSIYIIQRSTRKDICGETQATIRHEGTEDPDYGMMGQMRGQRLGSFLIRAMGRRNTTWRSDSEKLSNAFLTLKMLHNTLICQKCQKNIEADTLTPLQKQYFKDLAYCPLCRNTLIFELGIFRSEALIRFGD